MILIPLEKTFINFDIHQHVHQVRVPSLENSGCFAALDRRNLTRLEDEPASGVFRVGLSLFWRLRQRSGGDCEKP